LFFEGGPNLIFVEIGNTNTTMSKIKVSTPTLDKLEGFVDSNAIEDLGDRNDSSAITFKGTIFFIVAPWLRELIMEADTSDPFVLIPMVFLVAKELTAKQHTRSHLLKSLSMQSLMEATLLYGHGE
jgi:hypothetical protein